VEARIAALSDREVIAVLQELTQELLGQPGAGEAVPDENEAHQVLAAFLEASGSASQIDPAMFAGSQPAAGAARRLLEVLVADENVAAEAEELVARPPRRGHMGVDPAQIDMGSVVLGALITWLQTKVRIHIHRKLPNSEVTVDIGGDSAETRRAVDDVVSGGE
jgi:Effector Associated Constant Component 1